MSRGKSLATKRVFADYKYRNETAGKFINYIMKCGKKTVAEKIVYGALEVLAKKRNGEALVLFEKAIDTLRPQVEVRSRRVGGANYQVPMPVSSERQNSLAFRWLIEATHKRGGRTMGEKLAAELNDVLEGTGGSLKKKEDVHRMAEANKAFAHFARFASR